MAKPRAFQSATVRAALRAFRRKPRRFLVADEVGLGKTVVAQRVISRLMKKRRSPLTVFYVCSNLSIAAQNRRKLLEILPEAEREEAHCSVDRLTLVPVSDAPSHPKLRLYTLTPDTSIPLRKNRRRDGRQEERAVIHCLVRRLWPKLLRGRSDLFQRQAGKYWQEVVRGQRQKIKNNSRVLRSFYKSVRAEFDLCQGQPTLRRLREIGDDDLELIAHMRNALAACAIEELNPDLIIFDEFQNFRDLVAAGDGEGAQAAGQGSGRVVARLRGEGSGARSRLLLLSATPYELYTRNQDLDKKMPHHAQFFDLAEFLYGGDSDAKAKRDKCEAEFANLQPDIRRGALSAPSAAQKRQKIEAMLRPIMSRTERASHEEGWSEHSTTHEDAPLRREDIRVFKHLAQATRHWQPGAAAPYWSSIPLPAQTMGRNYEAWKKAKKEAAPRAMPQLSKKMRDSFAPLAPVPHPKLRALLGLIGPDLLTLPWLHPSIPWWPSGGRWKRCANQRGKMLIFSRFRAVPQAIASLVSYAAECQTFSKTGMSYSKISERRLLQPGPGRHALIGYFHPSPWIVRHTDPLACKERSIGRIRRTLRSQLLQALRALKIKRSPKLRRKRPMWALIGQIESKAKLRGWISEAWWKIHLGAEEQGLGKLIKAWDEKACCKIREISERELQELVDYALCSPGVAMGRALRRHWPGAAGPSGFDHTLLASWQGLRNYFDNPLFARALGGRKNFYTAAIMKAVRDGNLEAVLDEQIWLLRALHNLSGSELAEELLKGLQLRSGMFYLHDLAKGWKKTFSVRCHAALPFTEVQAAAFKGVERRDWDARLRTDEIRRAFNTPFWPHVLATTSVGQEGLDFHAWCSSLIHWDLSHNPVDLEQREGRIQRFAGHSVRRQIAKAAGSKVWAERKRKQSPWMCLAQLAERKLGLSDPSGLCPWWVCSGAEVKRYVLDVPNSDQQHWLELMKEQRALYRLVFGQRDQEDLLSSPGLLSAREDNRPKIMFELSAYFSKGRRSQLKSASGESAR